MSSGCRVLGGTVHLPEHSCTDPRGTECSGATVCSPEHSCTDPRGTECSGAAARNPEHSLLELPSVGPRDTWVSRGLAVADTLFPVLSFPGRRGDSGARGSPYTSLSTFFPALRLRRSSGNLGTQGQLTVAPSALSRDLIFFALRRRTRGIAPHGGLLAWPRDSGTPGS